MKVKQMIGVLSLAATLWNCQPAAEEVIDKAILAHGGEVFEHTEVSFKFRDMYYNLIRNEGAFIYTRIQTDTTGEVITDKVSNKGFVRYFGEMQVQLPDSMMNKFKNSVNSVAYFFLIPGVLKDPAAKKEYLGKEKIKDTEYYKVKVFFTEEGGGDDHEDTFVYWVNKGTSFIDYFAYEYKTNGGGIRFREAVNRQKQAGLIFCDYVNYGPNDKDATLENMAQLFVDGKLKEVSKIVNENVVVKDLKPKQ